jgi:hypothetical protein
MIRIADVIVPTRGVGCRFDIAVQMFPMYSTTLHFNWTLSSETGAILLDGTLTMSGVDVEGWMNDDGYVIEWALAQLGFSHA